MTKQRDDSVASQTAATREIELKIELDEAAMRRLRANPALKRLSVEPASTKTLRSIYFDTPDQALKARRIALRARKVGGDWIQTVKCGGPLRSGLSTPQEDEAPISGPEPELDAITDPKLRKTIARLAKKKGLAPAFETRLRRTTRQLRSAQGDEVELALDSGEAVAGERSTPILEAELELKSGDPGALFTLAKDVFDGQPIRLSALSKAERGYRLAAGEDPEPVGARKGSPVLLPAEATAAEAVAEILGGAAATTPHNLYAIHATDQPEPTHQFRVGLRRLRTALKIFRPLIDRTAAAEIETQAKALFRIAGALRDADVLVDEMLVAKPDEPPIEGLDEARETMAARRDRVRAEVRSALTEGGATGFALDLGAFVELEGWRSEKRKRQSMLAAPAKPFASAAIAGFWTKAAKYGDAIETLSIEQRHEMRKALKDLRYAIEFFQSLYPKKQVTPFVQRLKKLQDLFGALNDMAMAETLLGLAAPNETAVRKAAEELIARRATLADETWLKAKSRWKSLAKTPHFWE